MEISRIKLISYKFVGMKVLGFQILLFIFGLCTLAYGANLVLSLEEEELNNYIKKKPVVVLNIYEHKCPACKELTNELHKAAKISQQQNKTYSFVKINGNDNPAIRTAYIADGYPALRIFIKGKLINYKENFTAEAILDFLEKKTRFTSTSLSSKEEVDKVIASKKRPQVIF